MLCLQVQFSISQLAASGLKVNRLDMYGEVRGIDTMFDNNNIITLLVHKAWKYILHCEGVRSKPHIYNTIKKVNGKY